MKKIPTSDHLKTFVEHNASQFIENSGRICELANTYANLDSEDKESLFELCVTQLDLIKKVGKFAQNGIDEAQ